MFGRSMILTAGTLAAQRGQDAREAGATATIDGRHWDAPLTGSTTTLAEAE
jgi:hypothetical protein